MPLACEGWISLQHKEVTHIAFQKFGYMFAPTPFDVLHEHFGNIGASCEYKSIRWDPSSCNLQNWKRSKVKKLFNYGFRWKNAKIPTKNPLWIYRCSRYEILFNWFEIWTTSPWGVLLSNAIWKTEK